MKTASLARKELAAIVAEMPGTASIANRSQGSRNRNCILRANLYGRGYVGLSAGIVFILLALLTACSSDSDKPAETKPEVKGPELITARSAFQKLYIAARGWNQDAKPYRLESTASSDGNGQDGKWALWRCSFASPAQRSEKTFSWSGSAANGAPGARGQSRHRRQLQSDELVDPGI
jgi:hypothetical protein